MTETRLIRLLPVACLVAAICLFASELMTTFEFTPPGAEPLADQGGADRHGNALMVLAVFAIGALGLAVFQASKPAAIAVAVCGGVALLVFLLVDLPDANAVGTLDDARNSFFDAEAVPQGGFFLEMIGALALTICGIALATMTPEQLAGLRPAKRERVVPPPRKPESTDSEADGAGSDADGVDSGEDGAASDGKAAPLKASHEPGETGDKRRLPRRSRSRQRG